MELRSTKAREYKDLEHTLRNHGVYETGMELEEMRQVAQAIDLSANQYASQSNADMERALCESELDFVPPQEPNLLNSTMIVNMPPPQLEPESEPRLRRRSPRNPLNLQLQRQREREREMETPPREPVQLTVRADVHHDLNWSPPQARFQRKRQASEASSIHEHESLESELKRSYREQATPISILESSDSGVNWDERGSSLYDESFISQSSAGLANRFCASSSSAAISDMSRSANEFDGFELEPIRISQQQ